MKKSSADKTLQVKLTNKQDAISLAKSLKQLPDKKVNVSIGKRTIKFSSIAGRKQFVAGLEEALALWEDKGLENRLNLALAERDKAKADLTTSEAAYKEAHRQMIEHKAIMDVRTAAYNDRVAELEDNCRYLMDTIKTLQVKLGNKK